MPLPNIFTQTVTDKIISRLEKLTPETKALWGKMNASQMLAHCNVTYDLAFERITERPKFSLGYY